MIVSWFSGGITSAVATKIAIQNYEDVVPIFIETGSHHPDTQRFIKDCEEWFGKKITILQNTDYKNHLDLIEKKKFINSPTGAECSRTLKKKIRQKFERDNKGKIKHQVFGFEYEKRQINRALRFAEQNPHTNPIYPLIEKKLTKANCFEMIKRVGIKLPEMYLLGYSNNNCIGCVKGGKGYWNKIRKDFPDVFEKMSEIETKIGVSCINGKFLKDLKPHEGRNQKIIIPECDLFCEIEFAELEHPDLYKIYKEEKPE